METTERNRFRELLDELRSDLRNQLGELGANPDEDSLETGDFDFGFADSAQSTAERGKVLARSRTGRTGCANGAANRSTTSDSRRFRTARCASRANKRNLRSVFKLGTRFACCRVCPTWGGVSSTRSVSFPR